MIFLVIIILRKKRSRKRQLQVKHMLSGLAFIVFAALCGVVIAIWVFKHFNIYIPLENQAVNIDLQEPLQAKVQIHDALNVDVTGRVNAKIPIHENLNIPLTQTLTPHVYFDNQVALLHKGLKG